MIETLKDKTEELIVPRDPLYLETAFPNSATGDNIQKSCNDMHS